MKTKTNLPALKVLACSLLLMDIKPTEMAPIVVKHPFTDSGFSAVKDKSGSFKMIDLLSNEEDLDEWRAQVRGTIDAAQSAYEIYHLITHSYAFAFIKLAKTFLSQKDLSKILASAWICTEQPNIDPNFTKQELVRLFKSCDPAALMDENELATFNNLDATLTVFRGVTSYNAKSIKSLSWSLNKSVAEWFSTRYGEQGTVYTAQINKDHVLALFLGREEAEVIVDPKYLENITIL